jgi:hypothetical protein
MFAIGSRQETVEHAGTRTSPCRIYVGSQEGQSREDDIIIGVLDIPSENYYSLRGTSDLVSLKHTFDVLLDEASIRLIALNSLLHH